MIHQEIVFLDGRGRWLLTGSRPDVEGAISLDDRFKHRPIANQIGPPCLGNLTLFAAALAGQLKRQQTVTVYTLQSNNNIQNAALLAMAFQVMLMNRTVKQAMTPFAGMMDSLRPYGDICSDKALIRSFCDLADCLGALSRVASLGLRTVSPRVYFDQARLQNGGISEIVSQRLYGFADPSLTPNLSLQKMAQKLSALKCQAIIQFNDTQYNHSPFTHNNINIINLYFKDGGVPSARVIGQFLNYCTQYKVVGLHCKAGLGRTGTMACIFLISKMGFSAKQAIAWTRICRPGSISGPQGSFLQNYEEATTQ